jgi:hypothetical protein
MPDFGFAGKAKAVGFQKKRDFLGEFEPILMIQYTPFLEMCDALCIIRPLCRGFWLRVENLPCKGACAKQAACHNSALFDNQTGNQGNPYESY